MAGSGTLRPTSLFLFVLFALALGGPLGCEGGETPGEETDEPGFVFPAEEGEPVGSQGRLVIIGGALADENSGVYDAILEGRSGDGPICVLPTASGDPLESMEEYVETFNAYGGPEASKGIFLTLDSPNQANDPEIVEALEGCSGFFFTGGDQSRITDFFVPGGESSGAFEAVWERFEAGAVVSGSSAGAAIMSDPMIGGGSSEGALEEGIRVEGDGDGVRLTPGLGFLERALVDQHFLARGRWARLMVAVLRSPSDSFGFGIDENTALVVENSWARVVGASGVVFLDARDATLEAEGNGGYGVRLFLLGAGDAVDLERGEILIADTKQPFPQDGDPFASPETDLFSRWSLLEVLFELARAPDERLTFRQGGHFVEFRKGPAFTAAGWDEMGVQDTPMGLSLGPFVLSVWREQG